MVVGHHQHVKKLLTRYDEFFAKEYILQGAKYLMKVGNIEHELKQFIIISLHSSDI
jgi:hypothetical protein